MGYSSPMKRKNNAIYIDLENIPAALDLKSLLDDLSLRHNVDSDEENVFVIKMAAGNSTAIRKMKKQLTEYNFEIRDTPSITSKYKNRADLIISLAALETIIINMPVIDRYVFITSDSDFTVIMEMLRKYGKEVFLVTKEAVSDKPVFSNSCDEILILESYTTKAKGAKKETKIAVEPTPQEKMNEHIKELAKKVIDSFDPDSWQLASFVGTKFHQMDKSRMIERSKYKSLGALLAQLEKEKYITKRINEKGQPELRKATEEPRSPL